MVSVLTYINFFILFDKFRTSESVTTLLSSTKTSLRQACLIVNTYIIQVVVDHIILVDWNNNDFCVSFCNLQNCSTTCIQLRQTCPWLVHISLGQLRILQKLQITSILIGPAPTLLRSHWSRAAEC